MKYDLTEREGYTIFYFLLSQKIEGGQIHLNFVIVLLIS